MYPWREWRRALEDPFREDLLAAGAPDLDRALSLLPRPTIQPGVNPALVEANIERLETHPRIDLGHPFLDLSVKTGLANVRHCLRAKRRLPVVK